ncbi:MAG: hypothetical protein ACE5NN_06235 [Candidatus Bathyarchaeia archaeon]
MRTELCQFCLKSGILCSKCREKVRKGEISETDLRIARLLLSLEEKYPPLQNVYFHKAVEADGILAILVERGDVARMLSYGGKITKILGQMTGKKIRILEYNSDERKFLEDLFAPLSIIAINKIWLPDNTTETRVILKKKGKRRPRINIRATKGIAKKIQGMTLRVEFSD